MLIGYLILSMLAAWLSAEFFITIRAIRVSVQAVLLLAVCVASIGFGSFLGRFSLTSEGNNQLKNLTRGLVSITTKEDFDHPQFQEQLITLNKNVLPTYENYLASQQSVENFLKFYGIEYEVEIPIGDVSLPEVLLEE